MEDTDISLDIATDIVWTVCKKIVFMKLKVRKIKFSSILINDIVIVSYFYMCKTLKKVYPRTWVKE